MSDQLDSKVEDELDLHVYEEQDGTRVEVRLRAPAERCYQAFNDASHIAEWLVVVGTVVIRQRDDKGRATEIDFLGSLQRASVAYTLSYEYDDEHLEVRWRHKSGSLRKLAGSARFIPGDEQSCRLEYRLATELPGNLPPWADELYRAHPAETVVLDFCEWIEGQREKEEANRRLHTATGDGTSNSSAPPEQDDTKR
jgi:uncharacterized protein YndB with AHSA1/START domain